MVYLNPNGFDAGPENLDGYSISNIIFITLYSLVFYSACIFTWIYRKHPVLRMRNVPLMLMSLLTMHVFTFAVFAVYTMNGIYPCQVEYWCMCLYLPIGIGLYQAYNQQLLIVSRGQAALITKDELFKPIFPKSKGFGGPKYWAFRFKIWWQNVSSKGKYEGFVLIGIVIQVCSSITTRHVSDANMNSCSSRYHLSSTTSRASSIITAWSIIIQPQVSVEKDGNGKLS